MNLSTFKAIQKQVAELEKTGVKFDVSIQHERPWEKGATTAVFEPTFFEVSTLAQLSQLQEILGRNIKLNGSDVYGTNNSKVSLKDIKLETNISSLRDEISNDKDLQVIRRNTPSVKYYSANLRSLTGFEPFVISKPPTEKLEAELTYRYVGTPSICHMCVPHSSPLYVYLDKGFVFAKVNKPHEKDCIIITNELTPDSYLVMLLCFMHPAFHKQLENECFINFNKAKLHRIKFEKDLPELLKPTYNRIKEVLLRDYEKAVNSNMIIKVIKGELELATYNQMRLRKNSASYEGVTIEADNLMEYLNEKMVFDDRTDIYNIINSFIESKLTDLEDAKFPELTEENQEAELTFQFKINGFDVIAKRTTANTRRKVNGFNINKEELSEVCFRSSCFESQEEYDKFVKSVNNMSLKWHDAIGNGVAVKIHDGLTAGEYASSKASTTCPRIKFIKDENEVYLVTGEGEKDRAKIKLNLALKKLATLNRLINNRYVIGGGYSPRNAAWGRRELAKVLTECCTFDEKELIVDEAGEPVLNEAGKKTYRPIKECTLTSEKAQFIGKMATEYYDKAIKRSSLFLAEAVQKTGAKPIVFNGEDCWYVEGTMHKYAVSKKTNAVYNFERGNHICIVEPGHRVEVGFDATACRLLALKNDSVRVTQISTLRQA